MTEKIFCCVAAVSYTHLTNTKKCGDELATYGVNIYDGLGKVGLLLVGQVAPDPSNPGKDAGQGPVSYTHLLVPTGTYALVAQLDRVTDYESVGRGFESLPSHQVKSHD